MTTWAMISLAPHTKQRAAPDEPEGLCVGDFGATQSSGQSARQEALSPGPVPTDNLRSLGLATQEGALAVKVITSAKCVQALHCGLCTYLPT